MFSKFLDFNFQSPEVACLLGKSKGAVSTYTAVVDNLNNGGELASEGATADQDQAANLDQLPRSVLDIDIGHGEIL
jgi:hypothetical protein